MLTLTSCFQINQRPLDWPCAGITVASTTLNRLMREVREVDEFHVLEMKQS
jgi:hypothetical protein